MATFDDNALSKLTAKIDQRLSEKKSGDKKPQQSPQANPTLKRKRQAEKPEPTKATQTTKFEKKTEPKIPKQNIKPEKKRDPTEVKHNTKPERKNGKKAAKPVPAGKPTTSNVLLDEIKALGGDEQDLELVGDIDSEDETLGDASRDQLDKSLQAELAKFASGLGFEKVAPEEVENDEEHVGSDWEEASNEQDDTKPSSKTVTDPMTTFKGKHKTIFEPRPDWHAVQLRELPEPSSDVVAPYAAAIASLKTHAKNALDQDSATHSATLSSSSTHKFMSTIMSSGTISDKTSALTLAIQESPVHSIKSLENLMNLAAKRNRGQALSASAALVDLLGPGTLLPADRRLRTFATQPGLIATLQKYNVKAWSTSQSLPGKITKEHLISWAFEDWLKEAYFRVIQSLEVWCSDEVEYSRQKAIDMVYALLKDKPEQESNLLRLLVNKLGDRERKISSRASYLVLQLLNIHPGMKAVVVRSVEQDIVFKPGQTIRAKLYAVNTLNQTILSGKEPQIADMLLKIYFGMFVSLLKSGEISEVDGSSTPSKVQDKKQKRRGPGPPRKLLEDPKNLQEGEAAEKLVSAILTGINRAVPFSEADSSTLEAHLDTLFRITHSSNFNTSIQALLLIQQLSTTRHLATERFYRTLYESLLDPRLTTSSKQAMYLNLLYRSLKSDVDVRRVKAFVKRMLQVLNLHQPSFICGIIYLVMELWVTFPDLSTLLNEPEERDADENMEGIAQDAPVDALEQTVKRSDTYDGRKRVPEYSNAHRSCLWEILPYTQHFHPSVDLFASSLLNGQKPAQKPELANHTLINFLDKFVYKNPKAGDAAKGNSLMQPVAASGQGSVLMSNTAYTNAGGSLNQAAFWNKNVGDIAAEDVFFHEYFSQIGKPAQAERVKKAKKDAADDDEEGSEAAEDEIWEALKSSRPEVGGGDSDSEVGSDFEEMMGLDDSDEEIDDDDEDAMDVDDASEGSALDFSDASSLDSGDEEDEEAEDGLVAPAAKEGGKPESEQKKRRKMLKGLPTFASADDYAEMLAQEEEGM